MAKQVRTVGGRPPLVGSARGAEGHGTPPRLRRGCVPYYQHTGNDTTGDESARDDDGTRGAEGHGTPPRLRRGCVPYYQHTSNDTTGDEGARNDDGTRGAE